MVNLIRVSNTKVKKKKKKRALYLGIFKNGQSEMELLKLK